MNATGVCVHGKSIDDYCARCAALPENTRKEELDRRADKFRDASQLSGKKHGWRALLNELVHSDGAECSSGGAVFCIFCGAVLSARQNSELNHKRNCLISRARRVLAGHPPPQVKRRGGV